MKVNFRVTHLSLAIGLTAAQSRAGEIPIDISGLVKLLWTFAITRSLTEAHFHPGTRPTAASPSRFRRVPMIIGAAPARETVDRPGQPNYSRWCFRFHRERRRDRDEAAGGERECPQLQ